jgi:predicted P-loop ATPase
MFLISMIARVMRPGCKVDYMMILEGPQGKGKSKMCEILAGEWFSDQLPDMHSKEASQHLRGRWLIEIAELDKMSKVDTTTLKAFITRREERYRPPFGRYKVTEPRQVTFFGTTNDSAYLKDETGGRRFWPVGCGRLDPDGLVAARDQILAEAVVAFNSGEQWWPDAAFEEAAIKPVQADRYVGDAWDDAIARYVKEHGGGFIMAEVADRALAIPIDRLDTSAQSRIAKSLKLLGLRAKRTTGGKRVWV